MIRIKRIYDEDTAKGSFRMLVDRLWPRGIGREKANLDEWLKEIAPSNELRKWFHHDPARWGAFKKKYKSELKEKKDLLEKIRQLEKTHKDVTLLYAARDDQHNHAVVLKEVLNA